ncbi:hydroxymethylglutaryl-CoA lyase [Choristoneura fumiferana]|uniref:hydroxymethylglutaryl-CoA lyase n=1 Tax=Choristoneura fumiferana TaxID=7141 RepID=UPI003D155988
MAFGAKLPLMMLARPVLYCRKYSSAVSQIRIYEVGVRDGLQNEAKFVPTEMKVELINKLAAAGIKDIESASFVSPKWVKQMSDGSEVMKTLKRVPGVNYPVLIPNIKGYEIAKKCDIEEVAIFPSGSEGFSQKNLNCSMAEGLERFREVAEQAVKDGKRVRGYVSCIVGCPYDGPIAPKTIAKLSEQLLDMGCYEVSLGDTIGVGTAGSVRKLMKEVLSVATPDKFALHFHDTYGQGLSNLLAGLEFGITTVDSSISGLGGCPYARGATGNLATEDLVYLLYGLGVNTHIDLVKLMEAGRCISNFLGKPTDSRVNRALGDRFKDHKDIVKMAACEV